MNAHHQTPAPPLGPGPRYPMPPREFVRMAKTLQLKEWARLARLGRLGRLRREPK